MIAVNACVEPARDGLGMPRELAGGADIAVGLVECRRYMAEPMRANGEGKCHSKATCHLSSLGSLCGFDQAALDHRKAAAVP
jgi:hypothetical protein